MDGYYSPKSLLDSQLYQLKGCELEAGQNGRKGDFEELIMICTDDVGHKYRSRIIWNHEENALYDPRTYIPYLALQLFSTKLIQIEPQSEQIQIGASRLSNDLSTINPDLFRVVGHSRTGELYVSQVKRDPRTGINTPVILPPLKRY